MRAVVGERTLRLVETGQVVEPQRDNGIVGTAAQNEGQTHLVNGSRH
jgi:hypothetical protein